jgi:hypothetical protein
LFGLSDFVVYFFLYLCKTWCKIQSQVEQCTFNCQRRIIFPTKFAFSMLQSNNTNSSFVKVPPISFSFCFKTSSDFGFKKWKILSIKNHMRCRKIILRGESKSLRSLSQNAVGWSKIEKDFGGIMTRHKNSSNLIEM